MDCYSYAYEGRLMYESVSCLPDNWIFGNQYHIVSPPNLAALFYGFTKDSVRAMAYASSLSIILVLGSFLWCLIPFVKRDSLWIGVLCISGGIIFGSSAAMYISGLQVLYTMCAYYACYLVGILLTIGVWIRLRVQQKIPWFFTVLVLLLNFALGMQSLREMLILVIPLIVTECLLFFMPGKSPSDKKHKACLLLISGVFIAELAGHFYLKSLDIPATPIIGELQLDLNPSQLIANFWASTKNILRISGLAIAIDGIKYIPLSICALLVALSIIYSLVMIIRRKDGSPLAIFIVFSAISVICVYGVGIFFMRTRDIYYFIYWLLAALSIIYVFNQDNLRYRPILLAVLLLICSINYCYSFIPDFRDYRDNHKQLASFTRSLTERGIKVIYTESMPIFAAASHDSIVSQSFWFDFNLTDGFPLTVFPSDKHTVIYDDLHYANSLICLSDSNLEAISEGPEAFRNVLLCNLEPFDQVEIRGTTFHFFKSKTRLICPVDISLFK